MGESINRCFDCGTCTAICPVSESGKGFDPRKILHMIKMGLKDQILGSPFPWHCTHCDACASVCPQGVRFSRLIDVLRETAVHEAYLNGRTFEKWGTAPCKASCPAHISIQGFVAAIAEGRYEEGLRLIKEEMPFPGICGRICPHPCEARCNRGRIDKPVAIEFLKRFLADADLATGSPYIPEKKPGKKEKIAVIGAGPAGLTVAYYLGIEGYRVTVYEKLPVAGGMMAVGIPEFRLPGNILKAEIDTIKKLGVHFMLNFEIGRNLSFRDLQNAYQAIFIGIGCHRPLNLGIPHEDEWSGVIDGLTFLRRANLRDLPAFKGNLIIIGGGNTAIDCARTAKRLGCKKVAIFYRRTREEMPASPWEVEDTIEEEIDIHYLTAPVEILGKNGKVSGVKCIRMKLGESDDSGRRRPLPITGSEFVAQADTVVTAIGQTPDLSFLARESEMDISKHGLLLVDPQTGATKIPGIFSGGDAVSGPRTVVEAVAFGKKAARSMDAFLQGKNSRAGRSGHWIGMDFTPQDIDMRERESMNRLSIAERKRTFKEIDLGFSEEQAISEAERCFRICGIQL
jgi:NADPH-dependent glutamate synthase beta subunit-like oxidoreductase